MKEIYLIQLLVSGSGPNEKQNKEGVGRSSQQGSAAYNSSLGNCIDMQHRLEAPFQTSLLVTYTDHIYLPI